MNTGNVRPVAEASGASDATDLRHDVALVLSFDQLGAEDLPRVGGKGANLGEMTRAGLPVPPGFCVTTEAFRRFVAGDPDLESEVYERLAGLAPDDLTGVREAGEAIRSRLLKLPVPAEVETALVEAWQAEGSDHSYAVRSSATAEDLPGASFAGQQDTYLNVRGRESLVAALRRAWVSIFTDRAIIYRAMNGFDHREVALSAVVQRMVVPEVSGILFTADPLTGNRHVTSIDAGFGLGEALVSGIISADLYRFDTRKHEIVERRNAEQSVAIRPLPEGGTETVDLTSEEGSRSALEDHQVLALTDLGTRIQTHYGEPQDIEWVIDEKGEIFIVQSRPITSLFPLPEPLPAGDDLHLYVSFGHAQVMTDAISPMGRSIWRLLLPFGKVDGPGSYNPYLDAIGGRLYLDATQALRFGPARLVMLKFFGIADPLIAGAVREVVSRPEFPKGVGPLRSLRSFGSLAHLVLPILAGMQRRLWISDPDGGLRFVEERCDALVDQLHDEMLRADPGAERLRVAMPALGKALPALFKAMPPVMGSGYAARALLSKLAGNRAQAGDLDAVVRGLDGNVTTDMDLAVGDLADVAHRSPAVSERLSAGDPATAIRDIEAMAEGGGFLDAWAEYQEQYGMRGPSEIDIARPRWREDPSSLVTMVAGSLRGEPGAHHEHKRKMAEQGVAAGERLVAAAAHGPLSSIRVRLARRFVRLIRGGIPVREHPKFALIRMLGLIKIDVLETGERLVSEGRLAAREDVFWLGLDELIDGLENPSVDLAATVEARRDKEADYADLRPPRVMTSDGEIPEVRHVTTDLPPGALAGASASAGVVEGLARVVMDPAKTTLSPGEILIAPFTDPGWTPLFINAAALVMEVGGLMTHGSVVAREYGIPAVVGVLEATKLIETGQRVRVDGNRGFVEILDAAPDDKDAEGKQARNVETLDEEKGS